MSYRNLTSLERRKLSMGLKIPHLVVQRKEKVCFPQHVVTVELDTSCKVLLLINSIFIVTKIQKRPKKAASFIQ